MSHRSAANPSRTARPVALRCPSPFLLVGLVLSVASLLGCRDEQRSRGAAGGSIQQRQLSASSALLNSVTVQLRDLPGSIPLDLSPPAVILDSTSSSDGRDVMATLSASPGSQFPLYDYLTVPEANAGFKSLGIEPGDTIKYYVKVDSDTEARLKATGEFDSATVTMEAMDLTVSQVVGENALLISPPLAQPVPEPYRMEVWRVRDERMQEINNALARYVDRAEPPLGWEPTPDARALSQIIERLNQWLRSRKRPSSWQPAALVDSLPEAIRTNVSLSDFLSPTALEANQFKDYEGRLLQEAIWLRDIGRWAGGRGLDSLDRAGKLFDWTVRNVTLADDARILANRPWQTLLVGRGTAAQRAWVFVELCRQQRLPVCVLEIPNADEPAPWLWCGVLIDGKLHLFDPQLGLAIPGAEEESIATLADVVADEALLRALDIKHAGEDLTYPVTAETAGQAVAHVVADSLSLSWRASELQQQLSAGDALILAVDADALAEHFRSLESIQDVRLWSTPLELLARRLSIGQRNRNAIAVELRPYTWRPELWKARVLQFRGKLETEEDLRDEKDALRDPVNDHRSAGKLYMSRSVRPPERILQKHPEEKQRIYRRAKAEATYWLGLLQYELDSYEAALFRLKKAAADPNNKRRMPGIRYNRARVLEALGKSQEAAELLTSGESLQKHGDLLRARRLSR